jgi:hypothetical protein
MAIKHTHLITLFIVLSTGCFAPLAHASPVGGTSNCYLLGYSFDSGSQLYTIMENDSLVLGNTFTFTSNCEYQVSINNIYTLNGPTNSVSAFDGNLFINVQIDGIQYNLTNITSVTTIPALWEFENIQDEYILKSDIPNVFMAEILSNIITIGIVFTLSTGIIARKAKRDASEQVSVVI